MWKRLLFLWVIVGAALYPSAGRAQEIPPVTVHIVQPGETVYTLARRYGVGAESLRILNNLAALAEPATGQRLLIPTAGDDPLVGGIQAEVVTFEQTFSMVAHKYGVTPAELGRLNSIINPTGVPVGRPVITPAQGGQQRLVSALPLVHTSLWQVALQQNENLHGFAFGNRLNDPYAGAVYRVIMAAESGTVGRLPRPWGRIYHGGGAFEQGRTVSLVVEAEANTSLSGQFLGAELNFAPDEGRFVALVGIDRFQEAGVYPLTLTMTDEAGQTHSHTWDVQVQGGVFPQEGLRVRQEVLDVISDGEALADEVSYVRLIMTGFDVERRWQGLFQLPTVGVMSSGFGVGRIYNGGAFETWHPGSDFANREGTPIYAPAAGVVVDTANLEVRGLVTILDHGWGVYTGYWHQQSILVEAGDVVTLGQQIGTMGNTGLSTAAHLHWEMRVNGVLVEPLQWVREDLVPCAAGLDCDAG